MNWSEYSWRSERSEKNDLAAGCDKVVAKSSFSVDGNA
jgi:hypothetical protein